MFHQRSFKMEVPLKSINDASVDVILEWIIDFKKYNFEWNAFDKLCEMIPRMNPDDKKRTVIAISQDVTFIEDICRVERYSALFYPLFEEYNINVIKQDEIKKNYLVYNIYLQIERILQSFKVDNENFIQSICSGLKVDPHSSLIHSFSDIILMDKKLIPKFIENAIKNGIDVEVVKNFLLNPDNLPDAYENILSTLLEKNF